MKMRVRRRGPRSLEKPIENQILNYLRAKGIFAWKNQSVGIFDTKKQVFRKSHNPHHIRGVADILGILPNGRFLAIEVKAPRGVLTQDQIAFIARIKLNGGVSMVCRSLEDCEMGLDEHL